MDKRIVFLLVFAITLGSTLLVALLCIATHQQWIHTVLYSLATMWIMGILSQLMLQNLYHSIVKPIEDKKQESRVADAKQELNLDEVEEIDEVTRLQQALAKKKRDTAMTATLPEEPKIGSNVERTG